MKKRILFVMVSILILSLVFVGCSKDKEVDESTTTEKVSTTEPTTFIAPEIEEDETTEPTTEEQTTKEVETTKKTVSTNSGSSSGSSGSLSSSNKKPASTTKASSSNSSGWVSTGKNGDVESFTNSSGITINFDTGTDGKEAEVNEGYDDPELEGVFGANGR